jgi:serine/threonine-protein phosphatase PGAM5
MRSSYRAAAAGLALSAARFQLQPQLADCEEASPYNFPKSQLFKPSVPYPQFDPDWDFRKPKPEEGKKVKLGSSRHIILVRHGQYDESSRLDEERKLTELGRIQADRTGKRLAEMAKHMNVKAIHVSGLTRAIETADIISKHLPDVPRTSPNQNLNEGRPAHVIPRKRPMSLEGVHEGSARIEAAFRTYFYRSMPEMIEELPKPEDAPPQEKEPKPEDAHEVEIIVCHGNVIRYFALRALQLPPEAWLRTSTFNCSLTYLVCKPHGSVSMRMFGDVGHMPMDEITFSGHHGFNW